MPKDFFQDMVVAKRQGKQKFEQESRAVNPPPPEPTRPVKVERVERPQRPAPEKIIPPPVRREEPKKIERDTQSYEEPMQTKFASVYDVGDRGDSSGSKPRRGMWYVAGVSVLFLLFALSLAFSGAHINIVPKTQDLELNKSFSASLDADPEQTSFDVIALSGEEQRELQGGAEKDVTTSAKGSVVIYNTFSSASQSLDINTRLEGSNGKIYKTETKVVVPGMKGTTPGSVEVKVYASAPGEEYNSGPLDLTIFGFKGTPKYSKFYARSKGDMTGGFTGKMRVVGEEEKNVAKAELRDALEAKLLSQATLQIPPGFILFKDAAFLSIDSEEQGESEGEMVPLIIKGTLYGILFEENNLTKGIAKAVVGNLDQGEVMIPNIRDLTFTLGSKDNVSFKDTKRIFFNLAGPTKIVWKVDEQKIIADVIGKTKKEFEQIISGYPNIKEATLSVRPFWKRTIPEDKSDIKVLVNYPQ